MTYQIKSEHETHITYRDRVPFVSVLPDGTCILCEIVRLTNRVSELQESNTREITRRREAESNINWLDTIQEEHSKWSNENFGPQQWFEPMTGVTEEVGELAHSLLKQHQKIRGTVEEHESNAMDAVGDIEIYLIALCNVKGWNLSKILQDTWNKVVKKRNWNLNPLNGFPDFVALAVWQCPSCLFSQPLVGKSTPLDKVPHPEHCGKPMIATIPNKKVGISSVEIEK